MFYSASIYQMADFQENTAVWLAAMTAPAQVIGLGISVVLVDSHGRRPLLLLSSSLSGMSLIVLGLSFYLARVTSDPVQQSTDACAGIAATVWSGRTTYCYDCSHMDGCGFCGGVCTEGNKTGPFDADMCQSTDEWVYQHCQNNYGWLSIVAMISYLLFFGIGFGGLPWTINSEIFPSRFRSFAVSCSTATNWTGNFIISMTFLIIASPQVLTTYGAFWLYAAVAFGGTVWLFFVLPETKGLVLEDIERLFTKPGDKVYNSRGVLESQSLLSESSR
jgi:SP family myo-inositol transporter-like MFS transporter 13